MPERYSMDNKLYKKICDINTLKRAWHLVRDDARTDFITDAYRYSDFAFDLEQNLRNIQDNLRKDSYYPKPLLEIDVPKSSLAVRPGSTPNIEDRIVTYAIVYLIAPVLDKLLPSGVYSCRLKSGRERDSIFHDHEILKFPFLKRTTIQRRIDIVEPWYVLWPKFSEESMFVFEQQGYKYLTVSDIVSYFENISLEILRDEILIKFLPREQKIINLLMHILRYWVWKSYEGKPVLRGIPQGNDVSSFLGNTYLLPLDKEFERFSKKKDIKYFRYMDDVRIFSKDEETARESIFLMNSILRRLHLNLQGKKTLILRDEKIKKEIFDERLGKVNNILKSFREKSTLTRVQRSNFVNALKAEYKKIKTRKEPITDKDLRLFRRLITGFTLLGDPYLIPRILREIEINPDSRLMEKLIIYTACFPKRKLISNRLTDFLLSPLNQFSYQEAKILISLRYQRSFPNKLLRYIKKIRNPVSRKHWYVRLQALLLLNRFELSKYDLESLMRQYKLEKNIEVKRSLVIPLCQLEREGIEKIIRDSIFDKSSRISDVIKKLVFLKEREGLALSQMNYIFDDFYERRLIDEFYNVEIIKFSKIKKVKEALLQNLKTVHGKIKDYYLLSKVERVIRYLESSTN